MTQRLALWILGLVLLAAAGWWFATRTEWVEQEVDTPLRGDARRNDLHALQSLARALGVTVTHVENLEVLPPPGATLWLSSFHWDMFPERAERLERWVRDGGHLVVGRTQIEAGEELAWVPIKVRSRRDAVPERQRRTRESRPGVSRRAALIPCALMTQRTDLPAAYGRARELEVCAYGGNSYLQSTARPLWALDSASGPQMLRIAVGRGRVTAVAPYGLFENRAVLQADNALAAVAALGLHPRDEVWFVTGESRPALPRLLWAWAGPALLLGALALALGLWRAGARFGPLAPVPPQARRSVAEQVRGTAQFVLNHDATALLAAQRRATEAAARERIRHYERFALPQRAAEIGRLTSLPPDGLLQALEPATRLAPPARVQALALLETARRRLASDHTR